MLKCAILCILHLLLCYLKTVKGKSSYDIILVGSGKNLRLIQNGQCDTWNDVVALHPTQYRVYSSVNRVVDSNKISKPWSMNVSGDVSGPLCIPPQESSRSPPPLQCWWSGRRGAGTGLSNIYRQSGDSSKLWTYIIPDAPRSTLPQQGPGTTVLLSLESVLSRPRVLLYTSFQLAVSLSRPAKSDGLSTGHTNVGTGTTTDVIDIGDELFTLREGDAVGDVVHNFITSHVPQELYSGSTAGLEDAYEVLTGYITAQVLREMPMRDANRAKAKRLLRLYQRMCIGGRGRSFNVGVGEKKFSVVDRLNRPVGAIHEDSGAPSVCNVTAGESYADFIESMDWIDGAADFEAFRALWEEQGCCHNWILLELHLLDVTDWGDFEEVLGAPPDGTVGVVRIRAEHVWEHLTLPEAIVAFRNCRDYMQLYKGHQGVREYGEGGDASSLRVAVPDVNWSLKGVSTGSSGSSAPTIDSLLSHPDDADSALLDRVSVAFEKDVRASHCVQYTLEHLVALGQSVGFRTAVVEFTAEDGEFVSSPVRGFDYDAEELSPEHLLLVNGYIQRSSFGNKRQHTRSIIVDMLI